MQQCDWSLKHHVVVTCISFATHWRLLNIDCRCIHVLLADRQATHLDVFIYVHTNTLVFYTTVTANQLAHKRTVSVTQKHPITTLGCVTWLAAVLKWSPTVAGISRCSVALHRHDERYQLSAGCHGIPVHVARSIPRLTGVKVNHEPRDSMAQWTALISVSVALSQTPAYTVRPQVWG